MTTKSLRKQLMAAIAMVLVAAVALGSSTYAWFANNNTVTASTMGITAQTDATMLQIKANGGSGDWGTVASLSQGVSASDTKLHLVTPTQIKTDAMTWGTAKSTNPGESQGTNATTAVTLTGTPDSNGSAVLANTSKNYVLQQNLIVRIAPNSVDGNNLKVSKVTFSKGSNTIFASGRLLIVGPDDAYQLFNLVDGEVTSTVTGSSSELIPTMTAGTEYTLSAYFYFDGTDSSAYTDNATNLAAVTAQITLAIDPAA